jgi:radical SAM enzyme (TIGR01210 family)
MCDLWRHTLDTRVPVGAIPEQIDWGLQQLPPARHIKLYNSGNFFDPQAIPPEDYPAIADRVRGFATVIVENHPRLCGPRCLEFRDLLGNGTQLEVALGLETAHPETLARLNKQMTLDDFRRACDFLLHAGIAIRAFILLRPPGQTEQAGLEWALRSLDFAFDCGVRVAVVIPTRGGNGVMEQLAAQGDFQPPQLESLEQVLEYGLALRRGRVFVDLWNAEQLGGCPQCRSARVERLRTMNLQQTPLFRIECASCGAPVRRANSSQIAASDFPD